MEDGAVPSAALRKIEIAANEAFDTYRDLYYEGGVSSVYMWDLDEGFAAVVLIKKSSAGATKSGWDSIHVLEVLENQRGKQAKYKLTSTVMLNSSSNKGASMDLSGSMTRQTEQDLALEKDAGASGSGEGHIVNMGRMIEDMEFKMRHSIQEIYFGKTKDIVNDLRSMQDLKEKGKQQQVQRELAANLKAKSSGTKA